MPSVQLSPISARSYSVGAAADPYKRYWWAILGGFIVTGAWLCLPIMETPVGSVHVDASAKAGAADAAGSEQSLDGADNPSGAAGGALDLSMDGAKRKSKSGDEDMTSMLYQAAPDAGAAAAAGKPLGDATAASAASLAQQLKDAGKKTDASGWAEKAQRGFTAPHLAGGSLSGAGSASGGSSSASAGGNSGAFGTRGADVGFGTAHGLQGGGDSDGFKALKASASAAASPNLKGSNEAMKAGGNSAFDGSKGKPAAIGMGSGAMAQAGAALDAAPANLKANDPKLDAKKLPDPPSVAPPTASGDAAMAKQMVMMLAMAVVGGMVGGMAGQMVMMMGSQMIQQQQAQQAAAAQQAAVNKRMGTS